MEIRKGGLTEFSTELVDIALRDRVFAVGNGLDFKSEVGTPVNVNVNEHVTGRSPRIMSCTDSRVRVASIMSACDIHFEGDNGRNATDGRWGTAAGGDDKY